jgi:2'-5' RNA ligase
MTERLFFAIRPDAATAQRIEALTQALRQAHGLGGRSLGTDRFHVTLHLIGDFAGAVPPHVVQGAIDAARPVAAHTALFRIGFDQVASFTRKRRNMPLVLLGGDGVGGVARLQAVLVAALIAAQLAPAQAAQAGYTPHLTLLYDDLPMAPRPIDAIIWKANELLLVRSLLGQSRHEVLARLPLRG